MVTQRSSGERMSNVDTAWFRMEEAANMMMITGVVSLEESPPFDRVREVIEQRLLKFDRFRQRVIRPQSRFRNPRWEDDPTFDIDHHLQRMELPAPGGKKELQELVSGLMSRPLDFTRPLWQFHVVDGYNGGAAIVCRLHHCIADGITLIRVLLSLTDEDPDAPAAGTSPGVEQHDRQGSRSAREERTGLWGSIKKTITERAGQLAEVAGMGVRGAGVLGKLALPDRESDTILRGELGVQKRAAWSDPMPLADVKAVGTAMGGTVNDVLLTAMTGAVRRYLERHGEPIDGLSVRVAVPVNLRPLDEPVTVGNHFGLVFLSLPVGVRDPRERLKELCRRMNRLKRSPEALVVLGLLGAVGATPRAIEELVVSYIARKVTAVATNVPGPQKQLYLAGTPIRMIMPWVPQAARVGLGLSILSYNGEVVVGMATDAGLVPDPEALVDGFYQEFDTLLLHTPETVRARTETIQAPVTEGEQVEDEEMAEDGAPASEAAAPDSNPDRCQALTKAGRQCKLPAQEGSRFCHVHQP